MIGFLSAFDENEKSAEKEKISFLHLIANDEENIRLEASAVALAFARKFNLEKVYLFYGKDEKIVYDYSLQS